MNDAGLQCPIPHRREDHILLAHGEGARLSRRLIQDELATAFGTLGLQHLTDAAVLPACPDDLVMTTDTFVVTPLFFPGGDIGRLAIHGTINDLAVTGATPLYLSIALVLEEGLPLDTLRRVVASLRTAALECRVAIVTGDTKVVPRGAVDQMFVNTTGLGRRRPGIKLDADLVQPGSSIIVSGTIGDHGLTILATREELGFGGALTSDTASIYDLVQLLLNAGVAVRWMRDPTRGGVSAVLHELADAAQVSIEVEETALPIRSAVRGACEVLGMDPLYVANEGKLIAVVAAGDVERAIALLRNHPLGQEAAVIASVGPRGPSQVTLRNRFGQIRVLDEPSGALLPRIC